MIVVMIFSVIGYLISMLWAGWENVILAMSRISFSTILLVLSLSLLNYVLRFIRWQSYLKILMCKVPILQSFKIYMAGFALTATPAKAGEILRSLFLKNYGMSYHASLGAFFSERLSDLLSVFLLTAVGLWEYPAARPACIATGVFVVAVLLFLQQRQWLRGIQRYALHHFSRKIRRPIFFTTKILIAFRNCFSLSTLGIGTFLGVVAWGAEGVAFYFLLKVLGTRIDITSVIFIYSFSMLVGAITLLPGGLGGVEVTMVQLLILYHVPAADAVVATLLIRLATLWFAVILGLTILPFARRPALTNH